MSARDLRDHNERTRKDDRNRKVLEMWKKGMSYRDISTALAASGEGINHVTVFRIVKRELEDARKLRLDLATDILEGELERLTGIIRHAFSIIDSPCRPCNGNGTIEGIEGVPASSTVCEACRGDGRANHPDVRLRALREARAAIDQRVKMLGGYAPDKLVIQNPDGSKVDFRKELENYTSEELDRALTDFQAGMDAAERLAELNSMQNGVADGDK